MAIDESEAFGIETFGVSLRDNDNNSVGYFTTVSGDPYGTSAPVNTWAFSEDTKALYYKYGAGVNDWNIIFTPDMVVSVKPTYSGDDLTTLEYYDSTSQITANRVAKTDLTYTSDLLTSEVCTYYASDGTTTLKTITLTYTYNGSEQLTNIEVS